MTFRYDASASYLVTALRITHTVVPSVMVRPTFWLFFLLHLCIFSAYRFGYLEQADVDNSTLSINWKIVQVITAMTTFFEVFYTNHIFGRYVKLYNSSRAILGNLSNFAFDMRVYAGDSQQSLVRLACRYFLASVFLFFYEMNGEVSEVEWRNLTRNRLIKEEERSQLSEFNRQQRSLVVLHWSGRVVREAVVAARAPNNVMKGLVDRLLRVREFQQTIRDTLLLPMPFQYFHLLNMMVVVNLLLWAYGMGVTESCFAPVGFFFAELIFCGMMELAGQMSDPFGKDEVDFPLHNWLANALWDTAVLLEYEYTIGKDGWDEVAKRCSPFSMTARSFSWVQITEDIPNESPTGPNGPVNDHACGYVPLTLKPQSSVNTQREKDSWKRLDDDGHVT